MVDADTATRDLILKLASDPATVQADVHATGNMLAWGLTLDDVREAICQCIRNGGSVKQTMVKTHPKALVGQPAYEVKEVIKGQRFYIRMAIFHPDPSKEALLVLSVHPD